MFPLCPRRPGPPLRGWLVDVGGALAVRIKDGNNHLTAAPRQAAVSPDKVHLNKWGVGKVCERRS